MPLSTEQETLLDQTGVVIPAYLYLHVPELVFEAPLADAVVRKKAYVALEYGTPTVGTLTDIGEEMTLQIDIDGVADGGRQRVRGIDTENNRILIGRTGSGYADGRLDVVHGGTIRVYRDYRPFVKAMFISTDSLEIYKDEQLYVNANTAQPPVANAGTDRLIVTEDATAEVELDALGDVPSFAVRNGATLSSYAWDIGDGSVVSGDTDESDLVVEFPRGARWISLTVTDSNGKSHTTFRLIVVARPQDCVPAVIDTFTMEAGGSQVGVRVEADRLPANLPTGAKAIVAELENYGSTNLIGYRERFSGWLGTETAIIDDARRKSRPISLSLYDASAFLKNNYLFPQSLNIAEDTGGWYRMVKANIDRMMHHIIHWHTNLLSVCGFKWSGVGTTYPFPALTTSGGSFWTNLENLSASFAHKVTVDSRSQLRIIPDPHIQPTTDQQTEFDLPTARPSGVVTTFSEDRYTTITLGARKEPEAYWFEAQALIAAETITNVVAAIAPSNAPNTGTSGASRTDFLVTTAAELRVWAANQYAAQYGSHVGDLTIRLINPRHFIEPALGQFVGVELPDRYADRYNLPPDVGNRWTVESIEYTYGEQGKRATYRLRKEIVAPEAAKLTEQTDTDTIVQAWSGFDDLIDPFTGDIIRDFVPGTSSMAGLTQAELEQTLRRTWLKVGVGAVTIGSGGSLDVDDDGNVTDPDDDGGTIGGGSQEAQAARNGGFYEVARRLAEFWEKAQTVYTGIEGDPDEQARFEQFVKASIEESSDAAVTAWWTYINTTPDNVLPSLSQTARESLTGYMYCAISARAGVTDYITALSSTLWDRYFSALDAISDAQFDAWYEEGTSRPLSFYPNYSCFLAPPETFVLDTDDIHNATVKEGLSKNWNGRVGGPDNNPTNGSFIYFEASGKYEDATYIKDAFYVYNKITDTLTESGLVLKGTFFTPGGGGVTREWTATLPSIPPYNEAGVYATTYKLMQPSYDDAFGWSAASWAATKYRLSDTRSPSGTGTGEITVTLTDLGEI